MNWILAQLWEDMQSQDLSSASCCATSTSESQSLDTDDSQTLHSSASVNSLQSAGSERNDADGTEVDTQVSDTPGATPRDDEAPGSPQQDDEASDCSSRATKRHMDLQANQFKTIIQRTPGIKTVSWQQQYKRFRIVLESPPGQPGPTIYETVFRMGRQTLDRLTEDQILDGFENAFERIQKRLSAVPITIKDMLLA